MKLELHKSQKRSERFEKKLVSCEWTPMKVMFFFFAYAFLRWISIVTSVYVRTQVNFARVNKTEAMHGRSRVNVTVNVPRHFMYCLYFIYMYVRKSFLLAQGIISRDWKSTFRFLQLLSYDISPIVVRFFWSINWVKWMS